MALAERATHFNQEKEERAILPTRTPLASRSTASLSLHPLSQLIANATEAHSAVIFRASGETLSLVSAQTLSRDLIPDATFGFGQGLVGWVAANKSKVVVCPFENDATTLMYYSKEQELKSFIALPILSVEDELIGVLACDSKRSYAFPKIAEKVLADCAIVAGQLLQNQTPKPHLVSKTLLEQVLETMRSQRDERALLSAASDLPNELIEREALVVLCLSENGTGESVFFSKSLENHANNRLLEVVCRHKRLISRERSVQSANGDDLGRSFLSVPFRVLEREAGSLNLLSRPGESFSIEQVQALEQVATVVGHELERLRLASLFSRQSSLSDWKNFELRGNLALKNREPLALLRFIITNISEIEYRFGADASVALIQRFSRLLEQLRGTEGLLCALHGDHFLLLARSDEKERMVRRIQTLLGKSDGIMADFPREARELLCAGLSISAAIPTIGCTDIASLAKKTLSVVTEGGSEVERGAQPMVQSRPLSGMQDGKDWKW